MNLTVRLKLNQRLWVLVKISKLEPLLSQQRGLCLIYLKQEQSHIKHFQFSEGLLFFKAFYKNNYQLKVCKFSLIFFQLNYYFCCTKNQVQIDGYIVIIIRSMEFELEQQTGRYKTLNWRATMQQLKEAHIQNYATIIKFLSSVQTKYIIQYISFQKKEKSQCQLMITMQKGQPYVQANRWFGQTQRQKISAQCKYSFILDLCRAMKEVSSFQILHTDLSENNIVFVDGILKLIDFQRSYLIDEDYRVDKQNQEQYQVQKQVLEIGTFILKEHIKRYYYNKPSGLFERMKNNPYSKKQIRMEETQLIQDQSSNKEISTEKHFNLMAKNVGKTNAFFFATFLSIFFSSQELYQIDQYRIIKSRDKSSRFCTLQVLLQQMASYSIECRTSFYRFESQFKVQGEKQSLSQNTNNEYLQKINSKIDLDYSRYLFSYNSMNISLKSSYKLIADKGVMKSARELQLQFFKYSKIALMSQEQNKSQSHQLQLDFILEKKYLNLNINIAFDEQYETSMQSQSRINLSRFKAYKKYHQDKFQYYRFSLFNLKFIRDKIHSQRLNGIKNIFIFQDRRNEIFIQNQHLQPEKISESNVAKVIAGKGSAFVLKTFRDLCQGVTALQKQNIFYPNLTIKDIIIAGEQIKIGSLHKTFPLLSIDQMQNNLELACFTNIFFKFYCEIIEKKFRKDQNSKANGLEEYEKYLYSILFKDLQEQSKVKIYKILDSIKPKNNFKSHFQQCKKSEQLIFQLNLIYKKHHSKKIGQIFQQILKEFEVSHIKTAKTQQFIELNLLTKKLRLQKLNQRITCQGFLDNFTKIYQFCKQKEHQNCLIAYTYYLKENHSQHQQSITKFCDKCLEKRAKYFYEYLCIKHNKLINYKIQFQHDNFRHPFKFGCQQCKDQSSFQQKHAFLKIHPRYLKQQDRLCMHVGCEDCLIPQQALKYEHQGHLVLTFDELITNTPDYQLLEVTKYPYQSRLNQEKVVIQSKIAEAYLNMSSIVQILTKTLQKKDYIKEYLNNLNQKDDKQNLPPFLKRLKLYYDNNTQIGSKTSYSLTYQNSQQYLLDRFSVFQLEAKRKQYKILIDFSNKLQNMLSSRIDYGQVKIKLSMNLGCQGYLSPKVQKQVHEEYQQPLQINQSPTLKIQHKPARTSIKTIVDQEKCFVQQKLAELKLKIKSQGQTLEKTQFTKDYIKSQLSNLLQSDNKGNQSHFLSLIKLYYDFNRQAICRQDHLTHLNLKQYLLIRFSELQVEAKRKQHQALIDFSSKLQNMLDSNIDCEQAYAYLAQKYIKIKVNKNQRNSSLMTLSEIQPQNYQFVKQVQLQRQQLNIGEVMTAVQKEYRQLFQKNQTKCQEYDKLVAYLQDIKKQALLTEKSKVISSIICYFEGIIKSINDQVQVVQIYMGSKDNYFTSYKRILLNYYLLNLTHQRQYFLQKKRHLQQQKTNKNQLMGQHEKEYQLEIKMLLNKKDHLYLKLRVFIDLVSRKIQFHDQKQLKILPQLYNLKKLTLKTDKNQLNNIPNYEQYILNAKTFQALTKNWPQLERLEVIGGKIQLFGCLEIIAARYNTPNFTFLADVDNVIETWHDFKALGQCLRYKFIFTHLNVRLTEEFFDIASTEEQFIDTASVGERFFDERIKLIIEVLQRIKYLKLQVVSGTSSQKSIQKVLEQISNLQTTSISCLYMKRIDLSNCESQLKKIVAKSMLKQVMLKCCEGYQCLSFLEPCYKTLQKFTLFHLIDYAIDCQLLQNIFDNAPNLETIRILNIVSKHPQYQLSFKRLEHLKQLFFKYTGVLNYKLLQTIHPKVLRSLTTLYTYNCQNLNNQCINIIAKMQNLKVLSLQRTMKLSITVSDLLKLQTKSLKLLHVWYFQSTSNQQLREIGNKWRSLIYLNFEKASDITIQAFSRTFFPALRILKGEYYLFSEKQKYSLFESNIFFTY